MIFVGARSVVCGLNPSNVPFAGGGSQRVWIRVQAVVRLRDVNFSTTPFKLGTEYYSVPDLGKIEVTIQAARAPFSSRAV